ncbi:hypothetical protein CYMTET_8012 [Cymbomonas tetramitiformis]|uniref:Uncharacterized protein n=1 Tax=Cymbomonas tetramitiformis TaxID=36881 RepID=A0AAE0GU41_9CHLO|nr:hypothetical protein CYMTET_8012 [Cymbomonas tetramitiformis]
MAGVDTVVTEGMGEGGWWRRASWGWQGGGGLEVEVVAQGRVEVAGWEVGGPLGVGGSPCRGVGGAVGLAVVMAEAGLEKADAEEVTCMAVMVVERMGAWVVVAGWRRAGWRRVLYDRCGVEGMDKNHASEAGRSGHGRDGAWGGVTVEEKGAMRVSANEAPRVAAEVAVGVVVYPEEG